MKFITLTNNGYLDYTRNLIESLRRIDVKQPSECGEAGCVFEPLKVYCIGQECYDNLDYDNKELLNEDCPGDFQQFREGEWNKVMLQKMNIIHKEISKGENVIYTDGDIVWLNNRFQKDFLNRLDDNDILFQNDMQNDTDDGQLCCGLMCVKSNETTRGLFDISKIKTEEFKCDQIFFNDNKDKFTYDKMPLKKYPNGQYYWNNHSKLNPYGIHFNYVIGNIKKDFMKQFNYWFIS